LIGIIVWKELKEIIRDKSTLSSIFSILLFLTLLNMTTLKHNIIFNVESLVFYMTPCLGIIVGFGLSTRLIREKQEGVIETLLCTPITLRELWLGKIIGLTIPSCSIALISILTLIHIKGLSLNEVIIAYLIIVAPAIITSIIGILGLLYYILGMKQVQMVNYAVFFSIFAMLHLVVKKLTIPSTSIMSWWNLSIILAISLGILGIAFHLTSHLSKERIVTSIN